jgi:hypothetical protein
METIDVKMDKINTILGSVRSATKHQNGSPTNLNSNPKLFSVPISYEVNPLSK